MDIVVTDLTRFQNADFVCTAGIDLASRIQVRPMPYFTRSFCGRLGVRPGVILRGDFTGLPERRRPHFEDMGYGSVSLVGPCSPETFHKVLADSASTGLEQGFGAKLQSEEKHIPYGSPASASLATLRIPPGQFRLASGGQDSGKIKAHLTDGAGLKMRYLSITDLSAGGAAIANRPQPPLPGARRPGRPLAPGQRDLHVSAGDGTRDLVRTSPGLWPRLRLHQRPDGATCRQNGRRVGILRSGWCQLLLDIAGGKEVKQCFSLTDLDPAFVIEQKRVNGRSTDWRPAVFAPSGGASLHLPPDFAP